MIVIPAVSPETASTNAQNAAATFAGLHARRNSAAGTPADLGQAALAGGAQLPGLGTAGLNTAATDAMDSNDDITDAPAAEALMHSLRAAMLAQPGAALAAQGNLSPQSVLDLLE